MIKSSIALAVFLALAACSQAPTAVTAPAAQPAVVAKVPTNAWVGRWTGPEGLYLDIANVGDEYSGRYTIRNRYTLDDEASFEALADKQTLVFTRAGKAQVLRAATGDETAMKWLAGKKDCLMVAPGEGYCRD